MTLVLEAATYEGSVALVDGDQLIGDGAVAMRGREHEALMAAVGELFATEGKTPDDVDRIVCGAGPGSFTSLRIAASIAKGLAFATGATLIPVSSLTLLAASYDGTGRVLCTLDAMRGESYVQLHGVAADGAVEALAPAEIVATAAVQELSSSLDAVVIGPAASGIHKVSPRARGAARITNLIGASLPADLAAWEPAYGRLAEAQVKWEATHGKALPV